MLEHLLNSTQALGVGLVDAHGLLIEGCGPHDGGKPEELAVFLSHVKRRDLELFLGNDLNEQILVGAEYGLLLRWLFEGEYVLYIMVPADSMRGAVRAALKDVAAELTSLLQAGLVTTQRERLEQPRQFAAGSTSARWQGAQRFMKET